MVNVEALQWIGFVGIVLGVLLNPRMPRLGAVVSMWGCAFMTWWCVMIEPIPWGVFWVQVLACSAWMRSYLLARQRLEKGGVVI